MKIFLLAGTSDARALALEIQQTGYDVLATVVTENAALELRNSGLNVRTGRLTSEEMASFICENEFSVVVDASHPFAEEASKNAIDAAKQCGVPYIRYERDSQTFAYENMTVVDSYEEAAEVAAKKKALLC